jgi:RimJ/RimL family protein N-acetyltransferase
LRHPKWWRKFYNVLIFKKLKNVFVKAVEVRKKDTHELIGDVGIHFLKSDPFVVELGCTLNKYHQGKGYATEALTETISYLFGKLNKRHILASIDPQNEKSIKLVERLGFRKETSSTKSVLANHKWPDDLVYSIRKDGWDRKGTNN